MDEEHPPGYSTFEFHSYKPPMNMHDELAVTHNAFWSYCGPLLARDGALPPSLYEWMSTSLTISLLPRLLPFLEFTNTFLAQNDLDHYWLTIRATKATTEFDTPRWHTDDMFFAARGGGLRAVPQQPYAKETLDLQTNWKLCTTLLGPSTMFIPAERQDEARKKQRDARKSLATDHECASIRCLGCAATADAVRERLAKELKSMDTRQATLGECAFFRIGQDSGAVHSEPCMSGGDRIFVNVVPGKKEELNSLMTKWGMSFPRSWSIAPTVAKNKEASLWKY
ncbi:hypothetical protein F5Y18DRAFT_414458 [Xylariaceae sp. FL1019]|nr:hypothetical protein F5Y18DRAFT_414458 [Xylariaceae sp. FL1019]